MMRVLRIVMILGGAAGCAYAPSCTEQCTVEVGAI